MKKTLFGVLVSIYAIVLMAWISPGVFAQPPVETVTVTVTSIFDGDQDIDAVTILEIYGNTVAVTPNTLEGYEFAFWVVNGIVRADLALGHEFLVQSKLDLIAVFHQEDEHAVLFIDSNGTLIEFAYVLDNQTAATPELSALLGKPGYVINQDEPWLSLIGSSNTETITANSVFQLQYELDSEDTYTVTVNDNDTTYHEYNEVVTLLAPTPPIDYVFSHWEDGGVVLSYNQTYRFTVLQDRNIDAIFTQEAPTATPLVWLSDDLRIRDNYHSFLGQFYLPEGYEVIEYGFIYHETAYVEDITLESAGVSLVKSNTGAIHTQEFLRSFEWQSFKTLRAYLVYSDGAQITTTYSQRTLEFESPSIKLAASGANHQIAVTEDNRIFTWGTPYPSSWGGGGYLGTGANELITQPTEITKYFNLQEGEDIIAVEAAYAHSVVSTSYGRVFTFGHGGGGRLATGNASHQWYPYDVTSNFESLLQEGEYLTQLISRNQTNYAISNLNQVYAWGVGSNGMIGDGANTNRLLPVNITTHFDLDENEYIVTIVNGEFNTLAITNTHKVYAWGRIHLETENQETLTVPTRIDEKFDLDTDEVIVDVALGYYNVGVILTSNGRVFTWGNNVDGRLGIGVAGGTYTTPQLVVFNQLNEGEVITSIVGGYITVKATTSNNRVFGWGSGWGQELARSNNNNVTSPAIAHSYQGSGTNQLASGEYATSISTGLESTVSITNIGRIFVAGRGRGVNYNANEGTNVTTVGNGNQSSYNTLIDITRFFPTRQVTE